MDHPLEDSSTPYLKAVQCAKLNFSEVATHFGNSLQEIGELSYLSFAIEIHPGISTIVIETNGKPSGVYHFVVDEMASFLGGAAQRVPEAADIVAEICARNVLNNAPLPPAFRPIAHSIILGTFPRAIRRGAPISNRFPLNFVLYQMAVFLSDAFDLPLTRNETSSISACDATIEAVNSYQLEIKYTAIRDICTHKKYATFRARSNSFVNYLKDLELIKLGALRKKPLFGPFLELPRMTAK